MSRDTQRHGLNGPSCKYFRYLPTSSNITTFLVIPEVDIPRTDPAGQRDVPLPISDLQDPRGAPNSVAASDDEFADFDKVIDSIQGPIELDISSLSPGMLQEINDLASAAGTSNSGFSLPLRITKAV